MKVKPLITYCSGMSKSLKLEKVTISPVLFLQWKCIPQGQVEQRRCGGHLAVEGTPEQNTCFMGCTVGEDSEGKGQEWKSTGY